MKLLEIGPKSKEALSWMVISEVLVQSGLDLDIAVLHPGGGQYDTLSLVTFDGHPVVQINRNGMNAVAGSELVENIFVSAAKSPELAGQKIVRNLEVDEVVPLSAHRKKRIELAVQIGNFLAANLSGKAHCEWGWFDSTYGAGPNPNLQAFQLPESWKQQQGLFKETGWGSGLFLLFKNESPFAVVNMITGEIVDSKGSHVKTLTPFHTLHEVPKCHVGLLMSWKDSSGNKKFEDEIHVSDVRMTRRIYSEEYYTMPEEKVIFEFSCDEEEAVTKWSNSERIIDFDI